MSISFHGLVLESQEVPFDSIPTLDRSADATERFCSPQQFWMDVRRRISIRCRGDASSSHIIGRNRDWEVACDALFSEPTHKCIPSIDRLGADLRGRWHAPNTYTTQPKEGQQTRSIGDKSPEDSLAGVIRLPRMSKPQRDAKAALVDSNNDRAGLERPRAGECRLPDRAGRRADQSTVACRAEPRGNRLALRRASEQGIGRPDEESSRSTEYRTIKRCTK